MTHSGGVLKEIKQNLGDIKSLSSKLVASGVIPKFAILQIDVAQADLNSKIEEMAAKENLARAAFKVVAAIEYNVDVQLKTKLLKVPLEESLESLKNAALERRREFRMIESKRGQLEQWKALQTGDMLPTVYAFGKYELIQKYLTILDPRWAVGVGVRVPITAGLSQFPEREKAALLNEKLVNIRTKALQEIPVQVQQYYAEAKSAEASMSAIEEGFRQASEALRLAIVRFQSGEGSSMEVLSASNDVEKMQIKRLELLEQYNRNLVNLYWSSGNLSRYFEAYANAVSEVRS